MYGLLRVLYVPLTWRLPRSFIDLYVRIVRQILMRMKRKRLTHLNFGFALNLNGMDFIQRHLIFYGIWEPSVTYWLSLSLKPGDVFCDVGANIGYHSLVASRLVGEAGKVIALEASPGIYTELTAETRNKANIDCINIAVSNATGTATIYRSAETNSGLSSLFQGATDEMVEEAEISTRPLDDILLDIGISQPRIIKIDVEGAEWLVLEGMRKVLTVENPGLEIIVEFDAPRLSKFGISSQQFFDWFAEKGFHAYDLQNRYLPHEYFPDSPIPPPQRLLTPPGEQTDILFSRSDDDEIKARYQAITVGEFLHKARTASANGWFAS